MSEILELETRKKIYNLIKDNPGYHARKIAETLNLSSQLVDYHLLYLSNHQLISIEKGGGYKRCYVKGKIGIEDKQFLSLFRQEIPMKIVIYLLNNPYSRHRDMYKILNISSPRFTYHLNKLLKNGIIIWSETNGKSGYIVKDKKEIIRFIIRYRPSSIPEKVKETWEDFGPG